LLSDEFVAFSNKIAHILNEKKKKKQELKAFYDKVQAELAVLDDQAKATALEFEEWKKTKIEEEEEGDDATAN